MAELEISLHFSMLLLLWGQLRSTNSLWRVALFLVSLSLNFGFPLQSDSKQLLQFDAPQPEHHQGAGAQGSHPWAVTQGVCSWSELVLLQQLVGGFTGLMRGISNFLECSLESARNVLGTALCPETRNLKPPLGDPASGAVYSADSSEVWALIMFLYCWKRLP